MITLPTMDVRDVMRRTLDLTLAPAADDWRAQAVAAYQQYQGHAASDMRAMLAQRLQTLIGRSVQPDQIWVDQAERVAGVAIDGVLFQLQQSQLVMVRPCALCGGGAFTSAPLETLADVGYALTDWQPHHPACQPEDPYNWLEQE